jgi:hypothetical protein
MTATICKMTAYESMDPLPDVRNSSSLRRQKQTFLLKSAEWETGENFYTEIRTNRAFECIITWVGKGRFCVVYSKPHGDRTEFRKDVSTPGRTYYIMNKVGGTHKATAQKDTATLHLPSHRDAYWGYNGLKRDGGVGEKGLTNQWRVLDNAKQVNIPKMW